MSERENLFSPWKTDLKGTLARILTIMNPHNNMEAKIMLNTDEDQDAAQTFILLQELMDSVKKDVETDCLETAISSLRDVLDKEKYIGRARLQVQTLLIRALLSRFGLYGLVEDLHGCLTIGASVANNDVNLVLKGSNEDILEVHIAIQLIQAFRTSFNIDIINTIICIAMETLSSDTSNHSPLLLSKILIMQGNAFVMKYMCGGYVGDLEAAHSSFEQAERTATLLGHVPLRYLCLYALAHIAWLRSSECRDRSDRMLEFMQVAEEIDEEGSTLFELGSTIAKNAINDTQLQEAIVLLTNSLQHHDVPHPRRVKCLEELARTLSTRFSQEGTIEDLDSCIVLYRDVLVLHPAPHPFRSNALNNLGIALRTRFNQLGTFHDLEESILLHRESLSLLPELHSARFAALHNLAASLQSRFEQKGSFHDLQEAILFHEEALSLVLGSHPNRSQLLDTLGFALQLRFQQQGTFQDLERSILLHQEALGLEPFPHTGRSRSLNNLANALRIRFERIGALKDLEECIRLQQEALNLMPASSPSRSTSLNGLATVLYLRFKRHKSPHDLEECILLYQEALALQPRLHPERSSSLSNLASALLARFHENGVFRDLDDCIRLYREARSLVQGAHPGRFVSGANLASALLFRFRRKGDITDLEECVSLQREALASLIEPHPDRPGTLNNLAQAFVSLYEQQGQQDPKVFQNVDFASLLTSDGLELSHYPQIHYSHPYAPLELAFACWEEAARYETGSIITRLRVSLFWAACAEEHRPAVMLDAYSHTMQLLPLLASLDLTLQQRQDVLKNVKELVGDAAKAAITANQHEIAIVFLATGRTIFWSQALQLRTPVDELAVIRPSLAQKFIALSKQLEQAAYSTDSESAIGSISAPNTDTSLYKVADQRRQTIEEIRKIPGFEDFLEPPSFASLRSAADGGPIIFLNASETGCDALIMHGTGPVEHVPLPDINMVQLKRLTTFTDKLLEGGVRAIHLSRETVDALWTCFSRDMVCNDTLDSDDKAFKLLLGCLWVAIVQPIINVLRIEKSNSLRRIWWCPTGPFASLPIHAAGIYSDENEPIDCIFQYAVSSYCISPQDLLHPLPRITEGFKMTAVIEPEVHGAAPLPATYEELDQIENSIPDHQQTLTVRVGVGSSPVPITEVLSDIRESSFVHFGCHGMQNLADPLGSYLLLSGGRLTVSKIMKECRVLEGALAYLSACETAKSDEERPDESLNLVATMMFAGFRSVVGTMWSIRDEDAPIVAGVFYAHMFRNGKDAPPDVRDASYGLHLAMKKLQERGRPFRTWVPYVHYGI